MSIKNEEIFCLYTRAFTGVNQGMTYFQEHTESFSPFCDVDFIEFCYSIPLNLRFNHKIYFDWILQKYPGAADYVWEKKRAKIHTINNKKPKYMTLMGYKVPAVSDEQFLTWLKGSVLRRLGLRKKGVKPKTEYISNSFSMNPIDYWYNNNEDLRVFLNNYLIKYEKIIDNKELYGDMNHLFNDCVVLDKLQALSVLSTLKEIKK